MQENLIFAYYAQIWKFGPGPQKWNSSKISHFCGKVSRFRFQRALNHPQTLSLMIIVKITHQWAFLPHWWVLLRMLSL